VPHVGINSIEYTDFPGPVWFRRKMKMYFASGDMGPS
jgi:hypothetical protein